MTDRAGGIDRVLVVCSANQCRSPLAEVLLARRLDARGIAVAVSSAGVAAATGIPATDPTVTAASALGVDLSAHRSQPLDRSVVRASGLVLAMDRGHLRDVVIADPEAFARTFTLKELARRGASVGPRRADEEIAAWLARVHHGRSSGDLLGASPDDDIGDPTNDSMLDHDSTAREIDALLERIVELAWPDGD